MCCIKDIKMTLRGWWQRLPKIALEKYPKTRSSTEDISLPLRCATQKRASTCRIHLRQPSILNGSIESELQRSQSGTNTNRYIRLLRDISLTEQLLFYSNSWKKNNSIDRALVHCTMSIMIAFKWWALFSLASVNDAARWYRALDYRFDMLAGCVWIVN